MKIISKLFAKLFATKKTQTVQVVDEVKKANSISYIKPVEHTIGSLFTSAKSAWNGFTGSNKDKKRHFNKKRNGKHLRRKHRKAA
jgi:hypothetical protein